MLDVNAGPSYYAPHPISMLQHWSPAPITSRLLSRHVPTIAEPAIVSAITQPASVVGMTTSKNVDLSEMEFDPVTVKCGIIDLKSYAKEFKLGLVGFKVSQFNASSARQSSKTDWQTIKVTNILESELDELVQFGVVIG